MLGIDHAVREFHETHILLVKKTPSLKDIEAALQHANKGTRMLRHLYALVAMGIFENAPAPPLDGEALFKEDGSPAEAAVLGVPGSEDTYIAKQRLACAREIMVMIDEDEEVPATEVMEKLSRSWDRDKIVRPVLKRLIEDKIILCTGHTRGAVYSKLPLCSEISELI